MQSLFNHGIPIALTGALLWPSHAVQAQEAPANKASMQLERLTVPRCRGLYRYLRQLAEMARGATRLAGKTSGRPGTERGDELTNGPIRLTRAWFRRSLQISALARRFEQGI